MEELPGFTKEERIIFSFPLLELEKKNKEKATTRQSDAFLKKKEQLKEARLEFLKTLEK